MPDTWGGSWGTSWATSWSPGAGPTPPPVITPTVDQGGVGKLTRSARASRGGGQGGQGLNAWRREYERKYGDLDARLAEEELSRKKRKEARRELEQVRQTVARLQIERPNYYSENLSDALDLAIDAGTPRALLRRTREVRIAADQALAEALAAGPQRYVMTDDDIAAILLLS